MTDLGFKSSLDRAQREPAPVRAISKFRRLGFATSIGACAFSSFFLSGFSTDYRANYCEIFVQHVQVRSEQLATGEQVLVPTLTLKILSHRLDAPLASVGAVGFPSLVGATQPPVLTTWPATLTLVNDNAAFVQIEMPAFSTALGELASWEGAFFVESSSGKKLWANARGPQFNFVLTRYDVQQIWQNSESDVMSLNPDNCE